MFDAGSPFSAQKWLNAIFASQAAQQGRVVRRALSDIEKFVGYNRFASEVERRGFTAVRNGNTVVIFCNQEPVRRIV